MAPEPRGMAPGLGAHYNLRHGVPRRSDHPVAARPGRPHARPAARHLSLPAAHPHLGGAARRPVPAEQGHRGPVPLARPGRRVGRLGLCPRPRAQPRYPLPPDPEPGLDAGDGRAADPDPAPVHGQGREPHARARAERPFQRPRARLPGPDFAPGRHGPRHGGHRLDVQAARRAAGGAGLYRGRGDLDRHVPRGPELRGRAAGAPRGDRGIQPLGVLDAPREAIRGEGPGGEGEGVRHPGCDGGRKRRARGVRGDQVGRGAGAGRPRRAPDRGGDLPPQTARRGRRSALRPQGRARLVGEGERPRRPLREAAAAERMGRGARVAGDRRAGEGGDRPGDGRVRRRASAARRLGPGGCVRRSVRAAVALVPEPVMAEVTYLEALRQGLWEEMERDPSVFILGEDVGAYGGAFKVTEGFTERFGEERVIDTPISEAAIVGAAAGAAHMGMRPVAEMQFIDFISCAYDMLTNYVATARYRAGLATPIVVRGPCGGYVRGGPFHSQNPEAAFFHTPGLKIVYPATARDAKGLIKASIRDDDPVITLQHKWLYRRIKEALSEEEEILNPIGQARLAREGKDLAILTYGATVWKSLEAAHPLSKDGGLSVEVLDPPTLVPLVDAE